MARLRQRLAILLTRLVPVITLLGAVVAQATGRHELMQPLALVTVALAPVLLPRRVLYPNPGPPPSDPDGSDDDGGHGPPRQPAPPAGPRGGIPLPDADPARVRFRGHGRPALTRVRARRAPSEPERSPARTPRGTAPA
jgi:hypothetical protein